MLTWWIYGEKNNISPNSEIYRLLDEMLLKQIQKDLLSGIDLA